MVEMTVDAMVQTMADWLVYNWVFQMAVWLVDEKELM